MKPETSIALDYIRKNPGAPLSTVALAIRPLLPVGHKTYYAAKAAIDDVIASGQVAASPDPVTGATRLTASGAAAPPPAPRMRPSRAKNRQRVVQDPLALRIRSDAGADAHRAVELCAACASGLTDADGHRWAQRALVELVLDGTPASDLLDGDAFRRARMARGARKISVIRVRQPDGGARP